MRSTIAIASAVICIGMTIRAPAASAQDGLHHVLLAQASPAPPVWGFGRLIPRGDILSRDRQRTPAVVGFFFRMNPPEGWTVTWTDSVQASGQRLTQEVARQGQAERQLFFRIDPCAVTGLDTPGTEIPITYEFVFSASQPQGTWTPPVGKGSFILKLNQDTVPPFITSLTAPITVHRDETIQIAIAATDVSDEMGGPLVWDSGLRVFRLEGPSNPGGSGLQSKEVDDSVPQTCGEKVKQANHSFSYTVPHSAQPGDEIRLRAQAADWSGNKTDREVVLKVVDERRDKGGRQDAGGPRDGGKQRSGCNPNKVVRGLDFSFPCP
jgi:hypothetical protein